MVGGDTAGTTLGIVGWGRIGQAMARRGEGFGMEVIHSSRSSGVPLDELLERADYVSLHTPLTTRHAPPDRRARAAPDEADRLPDQHRPRRRGRPGRAARGAGAGRDRRRRARRHRPRAAARPTTRCCRRRTCSSCRTSARPPRARARAWPTWPSTTCSPRSPGARCRTPRTDLPVAAVDIGSNSTRLLIAEGERRARARVDRHRPRRGRRRQRPARRRAPAARARRAGRASARRSRPTAASAPPR